MMRNKLYSFSILLLVVFYTSQGISRTSTVGFAFGSPALVGLRATIQEKDSPWTFQGEYSRLVLEHNRTDGLLTTLRLDAQWQFKDWEAVKPFLFSGVDYFRGHLNDHTPKVSLIALGIGVGVVVPVKGSWSMTGEVGTLIPTESVRGFEFFGLIVNVGIRWTWLSPSGESIQ